jgi:hypothetical protein
MIVKVAVNQHSYSIGVAVVDYSVVYKIAMDTYLGIIGSAPVLKGVVKAYIREVIIVGINLANTFEMRTVEMHICKKCLVTLPDKIPV